jgi:hypothetical protein
MNAQEIARVCHEANRAYCMCIGDDSQPLWGDAPGWQKESAVNGVLFHWENPNSLPCDSHAEWLREKVAAGWKHGPVKDARLREHPCCVPYDQLPEEQRTKDALFIAIVQALT